MIPLALVTGYLGTGKTTLLRRIVARHRGRRLVYVVNEFAPRDLDGELVRSDDAEVVAIPGGSIFCRCLVSDFIRHLQAIPNRLAGGPPDGVVIEASGVANPVVVQRMLRETGLDRTYALALVVAVADPRSLPRLVRILPNVQAQLRAADLVLLNKTDLHPESGIAEAEAVIRETKPDARILRTVRCDADFDLFPPAPDREPAGEYAPCRDPNVAAIHLVPGAGIDLEAIRDLLGRESGPILRLKGVVPAPGGPVRLEVTSEGLEESPAREENAHGGVAVILAGAEADRLTPVLRSAFRAE
jgi:G3E family GTPase